MTDAMARPDDDHEPSDRRFGLLFDAPLPIEESYEAALGC
jgi:hypothetical protein